MKKKSTSVIISILICLVTIIGSYIWATAMMDSLYAYRSPVHNNPPLPGDLIGNAITHSVVFVLIDGLRYDTSIKTDVMPFLNRLRNEGAYALMHSRPPSYSQIGYGTILTGAWPAISDAPIINLDYSKIPTFTQDDIFSAAHRAGLFTAIAAYDWFEKLVPQESVSTSFYTSREDQYADRQVLDAALPWIKEGKYQLILVHIDQVDYAGHHEGGPIDPRWDIAAKRSDELLSEIVSVMNLSQDTVIVTSDHGHIDRGNHGGQEAVTLLEPFVMAGKNVIHGDYGNVNMVDVAPTMAVLLGTNIPASSQGQPLYEMLNVNLDQVAKINRSLYTQQDKLAQAIATAIGVPINKIPASEHIVADTQSAIQNAVDTRLNNERTIRVIIGILVFILLINVVLWHVRPYTYWAIAGILLYLIIFNIKYLLIDHKTYSLSSVIDADSLILFTAITTMVSLVIAWAIFYLGSQSYRLKPGKAAEVTLKFVLTVLVFFSIPVLVNYVYNGPLVTWALPNFLLGFLGLIFLIQTLVIGAIGLVLTGIASIISVVTKRYYMAQEPQWN